MAKVLHGNFTGKQNSGPASSAQDKPIPGYQLTLGLAFSDPLIWRTIRVPGNMTLATLHKAIQVCMGWNGSETHQFLVGKVFYQSGFGIEKMEKKPEYDENKFQLYQLEEGMQFLFTYLYDGGEGWEVEITLDEVISEGHAGTNALLINGERACPPEEVGDIHQFQAFLTESGSVGEEALLPAGLPELAGFDPEKLDMVEINSRLAAIC